jgi:hypothetical protein
MVTHRDFCPVLGQAMFSLRYELRWKKADLNITVVYDRQVAIFEISFIDCKSVAKLRRKLTTYVA